MSADDRIEKFVSDYKMFEDDDFRVDLILLCSSFYEQGLREREDKTSPKK